MQTSHIPTTNRRTRTARAAASTFLRFLFSLITLACCGVQPASYAAAQQLPVAEDVTATPVPFSTEALRKARVQRFLAGRRLITGTVSARALANAHISHSSMLALPRNTALSTAWTALGPAQVSTAAFGNVTGRVTSIALDDTDPSGNTVYVGTTGGGVWKSTNAAGPQAQVTFTPLTDALPVFSPGTATTPSLSIGALAIANHVLLAGTGDPNDALDSYYGTGILRSTDGGTTWSVTQQSLDGAAGNHSFFGLGFAGFAFSSLNPSLVVAALSQAAEGDLVNAANQSYSVKGLYYSADAGLTWHLATVTDGGQVIQAASLTGSTGNAATAVVWNPIRQRFYAALRAHGYYESSDGVTWTRLAHQPGTGLTTTACPANSGLPGSTACPIFRGALAVQPVTGDTFALTVSATNIDQGLYRDVCALSAGACATAAIAFGSQLNAAPLETGSAHLLPQGDYNLSLAATSSGTDTLVFAGTIDLYRCSLNAGCTLRNTTNAQNGCASNALVAPAQHAITTFTGSGGPLLYLGNDGGLWRSTDGVNQTGAACSLDDANHFQNLNSALGSLAEVSDFAQAAADPGILLAGLGALGTAGTNGGYSLWPQLATGEGSFVAIDPANSQLRLLSNGAGVSIARCTSGAACGPSDFATPVIGPAQTASDPAEVHTPWTLDPGATTNVLLGTCRVWRGPAAGGALWSRSNAISAPLAAPATTTCTASSPLIRSLAAGGTPVSSQSPQNTGSPVLYAGLAGSLDGGQGLGGHVFATTSANTATNTTPWTDIARSPVTNDLASGGTFNPGGFDVSSLTADPHDATGQTVYATVMGFDGNGVHAPHLYRSLDAGAHWLNLSSNLPNAPANSVAIDPNDANTVYIALDTGVYVTTQITTCSSTNCWSPYGTSLPNTPIITLAAAGSLPVGDGRTGLLRAGTYGRGIWQIPLITAAPPAAAAITLGPASVTFPAQQAGTVSSPVPVTVTNSGTATLQVSSVLASGDFLESDTCTGTSIAPGATCTVNVRFAPTATGARNGLLTLYANVPGGQATAALSGTATAPAAIVLTPTSLAFPATPIGNTSPVQNITLSNTGGVSANVQPAVIAGDFRITANTCTTTLAPQTGCTISIVFAPTASGVRSGTLTFVDDAGTQVASLSGTGNSPATDALAPLTLTFPATQLSLASPTQAVTLTNSGDVALTLITTQITAGDFHRRQTAAATRSTHTPAAPSTLPSHPKASAH